MKEISLLLMSSFIGAGIGGFTNALAIRMLFRPYQPRNLGRWTLPFTPGLIPKRHKELATQLGHLVEQHLFTKESIQQKLLSSAFQAEIHKWAIVKAEDYISSNLTLSEALVPFLGNIKKGDGNPYTISALITEFTEKSIESFNLTLEQNTVGQVIQILPIDVEKQLEHMADNLIDRGERFILSQDGEVLLYHAVQQAMDSQGALFSMLGMFISKDKLVEKLQEILLPWLKQPSTRDFLLKQLLKLKDELWEQNISGFLDEADSKQIQRNIIEFILQQLPLEKIDHLPLAQLLAPWKEDILELVPRLVDQIGLWFYEQIPHFYQQLNIPELVKEQVLQFPLSRIERMIKELANKELRMITWLGALLGGIIGLLQAILLLIFL